MKTEKLFHITTFGCQMNEYDSRQMEHLLAEMGYSATDDESSADVILINTCSIRDKPEQKVFSHLGRLRPLKMQNSDLIIGVCGCVAQQHGDYLLKRVGHLDFVFGTHYIHRLPEMLTQVMTTGGRFSRTDFTYDYGTPLFLPNSEDRQLKAMLTIMRGCNNFCTYCIVPYVRGREVSRPGQDILEEARNLVSAGVREITLLGQNVNSYRSEDGSDFAALLRSLDSVQRLDRIRFTTSHPKDISKELIALFGEMQSLCPHIHLPFQSGSNRILKRMNRGYSREEYLKKIELLYSACPGLSITTDMIVGFPGEEDEDFRQTLDLMREAEFSGAFSFKYSERPHAKASGFSPKVPEEVKSARLAELQALQDEMTLRKNRRREGTTEAVLVEGRAKRTPQQLTGRTGGNQIVNFIGPDELIGQIVPVSLVRAFIHSISGLLPRAA